MSLYSRKDESIKGSAKVCRKLDSNTTTTAKKAIEKSTDINKSNINKMSQANNVKTIPLRNKSYHKNCITGAKQKVEESRASLLQKIKFLEEELEKYDFERNRITQELDRVCEEKDIAFRKLKFALEEKQLEIDEQMCSHRRQRNELEEEMKTFKLETQAMKLEFSKRESDLIEKNESLEKQLLDLNDYMKNKEQTLAKIRELEETIKQQNVFHKRIKEKLINEVQNEKLKVEELVTKRVNEIKKCLESSCLDKLSIDARIALEKFGEMSKSYESCERECIHLRKDNQILKQKIKNQKIYLEVSESLLHEMLKQMNRKLVNRKHMSVQTDHN